MNKICQKCGNTIPEGMEVCPQCEGAQAESGSDILKVALNSGTESQPEIIETTEATETSVTTDSTEISAEQKSNVPEEEKKPRTKKRTAGQRPANGQRPAGQRPANGKRPAGQRPANGQRPAAQRPANGKRPAGQRPANGQCPAGQRPANGQRPAGQKTANGQRPAGQRPVNSQKARATAPVEEEKKGNRGAVIGITVGLIAALLLIAGGATFMLYKMGFFNQMSDEELLATNRPAVESVVEAPSVEEVPEILTESAVEEEPVVEDSILEGSSFEETFVEEVPVVVPEDEEAIVVSKFKVTGAETIYLYARGQTVEPVYVIEPTEAAKHIEWTSSDETIATVNNIGVISARRGGSCTITGTCGDQSITLYIQCSFEVPTTILDMNLEDITMNYEGQTAELAIDYDLTEEQIAATIWESSNPEVAMVDEAGNVTALTSGTAIITASIGEYTASCIVRCVNVTGNRGVNNDSSEFVINYEDVTLTRKGEYFELKLKSVVGNELPEFEWKSSNKDVATVDSNGVVTAVGNGTANITTSVGGDDFRCIVRVRIDG